LPFFTPTPRVVGSALLVRLELPFRRDSRARDTRTTMHSPPRSGSPRSPSPFHSLSPPRPGREFFPWEADGKGSFEESGGVREGSSSCVHNDRNLTHHKPWEAHPGPGTVGSPSLSREGSLRGGERLGPLHEHEVQSQNGMPGFSPSTSRGGSLRGGDRFNCKITQQIHGGQQPLQPLHKHSGVYPPSKKKQSSTLGFVLLLVFVALLAPIVYHQQHKHHFERHRRTRESVVFRDDSSDTSNDHGRTAGALAGGWGSGTGEASRADARRTGDPIETAVQP